jgi:hypothetical protein
METLKKLYYNINESDVAFSSAKLLYQAARKKDSSITQRQVRSFLEQQKTYNLHKRVNRKFRRQIIKASGLHTDFQV